jgi:hypothetical protein
MKYEFDAEIKMLEGKMKWPVVYFPHPAAEHFGTNGRVNVKAVVDDYEFECTLLPSRNGHYLVYNVAVKKAVGKKLGDTVHVALEKSEEKRELIIPDYVLTALKENGVLDAFLAKPYYMSREEIVKIESAQREETKANRLRALIDKLAR